MGFSLLIYKITVNISNYIDAGTYQLIAYIREVKYEIGNITISPPPPVVSELDTYTSDDNLILRVTGDNFIPESTQVFLVKDANETETTNIYRLSSYRAEVVVPPFLASGTYPVKVVTGGKTVTSSSTISITENTTGNPVIYSVSPKKVKEGGTFTIAGKNFTGKIANIGFMDGYSATKAIEGKIISSTQIEVTLPTEGRITIPASTYEIYVNTYSGTEPLISNSYYNLVVE